MADLAPGANATLHVGRPDAHGAEKTTLNGPVVIDHDVVKEEVIADTPMDDADASTLRGAAFRSSSGVLLESFLEML